MIILREFLKEKRWYNEEIKIGKFVIFCISLAASLIFWFTQVRKGDRIGPVITMDQQELTVGLNATDEDFCKE